MLVGTSIVRSSSIYVIETEQKVWDAGLFQLVKIGTWWQGMW